MYSREIVVVVLVVVKNVIRLHHIKILFICCTIDTSLLVLQSLRSNKSINFCKIFLSLICNFKAESFSSCYIIYAGRRQLGLRRWEGKCQQLAGAAASTWPQDRLTLLANWPPGQLLFCSCPLVIASHLMASMFVAI